MPLTICLGNFFYATAISKELCSVNLIIISFTICFLNISILLSLFCFFCWFFFLYILIDTHNVIKIQNIIKTYCWSCQAMEECSWIYLGSLKFLSVFFLLRAVLSRSSNCSISLIPLLELNLVYTLQEIIIHNNKNVFILHL